MAGVKELFRVESDGSISFGDYELEQKKKLADIDVAGDLYKVKTFKEITKLERNDTFVFESVPGTAVTGLKTGDKVLSFIIEGDRDAQVTLGMEEDTEYQVLLDGVNIGHMTTGMGGKLSFSTELENAGQIRVQIVRVDK